MTPDDMAAIPDGALVRLTRDAVTLTVGELFAGYGGLGMGLAQVLDTRPAWFVENDPGASRILAHHWPQVPNLGDITAVDWSAVEPVDVLTGGFPCQDVSTAGLRRGLKPGTRSGLWTHMAYAIDRLRPRLVIIENVRGLLSAEAHSDMERDCWCVGDGRESPLRALGAVLGDLADLGMDARWVGVRASDVGAPHQRYRIFVAAYPADTQRADWRGFGPLPGLGWRPDARDHLPGVFACADAADASSDGRGEGRPGSGQRARDTGQPAAADADQPGPQGRPPIGRAHQRPARAGGVGADPGRDISATWGAYAPAILRWEMVLGRTAPPPTAGGRLNPLAVEFMMGLPAGHVTDPAIGLTDSKQLKALGNGVVPQQAAHALHLLGVGAASDVGVLR